MKESEKLIYIINEYHTRHEKHMNLKIPKAHVRTSFQSSE